MWLGIHSIRCESTATVFGYDDVIIRASIDAAPETMLDRVTINDGEIRELFRMVHFTSSITLRFSDVHLVDEEIGTVVFHAANSVGTNWQPQTPNAVVTGGNGKYTVAAQVIDGTPFTPPPSFANFVVRQAIDAWIGSMLTSPAPGTVASDADNGSPWTGRIGVTVAITDPTLLTALASFLPSASLLMSSGGPGAGLSAATVTATATFNSIAGRAAVIQQVIDRVGDRLQPNEVPTVARFPAIGLLRQLSSNTCVPLSVALELILRAPWRFVSTCQTLYETGSLVYDADSLDPMPSSVLVRSNTGIVTDPNSTPPTLAPPMAPLDWMIASALAESAEWDSDVNSSVEYTGVSPLDTAEMLEEQLNYLDVLNNFSGSNPLDWNSKTTVGSVDFEDSIAPIMATQRRLASASVLACFRSAELIRAAANFASFVTANINATTNIASFGGISINPAQLLNRDGVNATFPAGFTAGVGTIAGAPAPFVNHCVCVFQVSITPTTTSPDDPFSLVTLVLWTRGSVWRLTLRRLDLALCLRQVVIGR